MLEKDLIKAVKTYGYTPIIFILCIGLLYQLNEERKQHLREIEVSRKEYVESIREITKSIDGFSVRLYNIEKKIGG